MRNTDLRNVLFPVELRPLFFAGKGADLSSDVRPAGDYKAVVDVEREQALGVVGPNYELITNGRALELGRQGFSELLRSVDPNDLEVFNIVTPTTRSYCHIDLIHRGYDVNVWRSEVYLPYLRITNSYNRTRALRFNLGFVRKLCDNGLIFERETLEFKFSHTSRDLSQSVRFHGDTTRITRLEDQFRGYVKGLLKIAVPQRQMPRLMAMVLGLRFRLDHEDPRRRDRERQRLEAFRFHAQKLASDYARDVGANAYAAFNAMTEYASHPDRFDIPPTRIDTLQKRITSWGDSFPADAAAPGFQLQDYTGEYDAYFN
jgi:hypothetical protein